MSCEDSVITVQNLSKEYYFFSSGMLRLAWVFFGLRRSTGTFCALEDISVEIKRGESLGIIGTNGSGKSTFLKLLAGTTLPSSGKVEIRGRVAALLELGLGFHSELTGQENVVLNAFFSGISKQELPEKLVFIREFSELGDFFYRPVRMYSTGMFMRLAFSMAIAVEPEILIVDEALSVGDERFQKKCVDYIGGLLKKGVTLIFCSHDMYMVEILCSRTIWLERGQMKMIGPTRKVAAAYQDSLCRKKQEEIQNFVDPPIILKDIELWHNGMKIFPGEKLDPFSEVSVRLCYQSLTQKPMKIHFGMGIYSADDIECFATSTGVEGLEPLEVGPGEPCFMEIHFPEIRLMDGSYTITGIIQDETAIHVYHRLIKPGLLKILLRKFIARGTVYLDHQWKTCQKRSASPMVQ